MSPITETLLSLLVLAGAAFTFIGSGAFTGVAGQLRAFIGNNDGSSYVLADVNGDGIADFQIALSGSMQLTAINFLL